MIKKFVAISLFIFWVVVTAILIEGLLFYQSTKGVNPSSSISQKQLETPSNSQTIGGDQNKITASTLSSEEVAKHNGASDCWLIINDKVYDVSSYINIHPGNPETIIPYCGKEATNAFETKDKGKPHSQEAGSLLNDYYIGDINQQIIQQNLQQSQEKIQTSPMNTLRDKLLEKFPNAQIIDIRPKKEAGIYEAKLIFEGKNYKVKIDSSGDILKVEVEKED